MKMFHVLLAYYSAAVATGLFIWSVFFATTPDRVTIAILILPIAIYFWLIATGVPRVKFHNTSSSGETSYHEMSEANLLGGRNRAHIVILVLLSFFLSAASLRLYMSRSLSAEGHIAHELNAQLKTIQEDVDRLNKLTGSVEKLSIKLDVLQHTYNTESVDKMTDDLLLPKETHPTSTASAGTQ